MAPLTKFQKYRIAREASGMTTQQLCELWNCSNGDLANVSQGKHNSPRLEALLNQFIKDNWPKGLNTEEVSK